MINELIDIEANTPIEVQRTRFAQVLGWPDPVPEPAFLRAIDDPNYAAALITSRHAPGFLQPLLEDPRNAKWARQTSAQMPARSSQTSGELVGRAATALWRWGRAGFSIVDEDVLARREEACLQCPHLAEPDKMLQKLLSAKALSNRVGERTGNKICNSCGCQVAKKMRLPTESCPESHPTNTGLTRWGEPVSATT